MMVVLVGLVYCVVWGFSGATLFQQPRLTFTLAVPTSRHGHVTWLLPGSTLWEHGVRAGDTVVSLDGHPPTSAEAGSWSGQRVRIRDSAGTEIVVVERTATDGRVAWPLLVLSPWFMLLGALILLRAPKPTTGRTAYALFAAIAFALALAPATDADQVWAALAEPVADQLFAASFLLFFLLFPVPRGMRVLRRALWAPPLLAIAWSAAALGNPTWYDPSYLARMGILLLYPALGVGLLVWSMFATPDPFARQGIRVIGAGAFASIAPFLVLYLLPVVAGQPPILPAEAAILALIVLPISFAYAMLRHDALHVPLFQRWLVHGLLWTGLLAVYAFAFYGLHYLLAGGIPLLSRSMALSAALVLLIGVSVQPLHRRLRDLFDRLIFRDGYNYRRALERLSREVALTADLSILGASLTLALRRLMNLHFAALLLQDSHGSARLHGTDGAYDPSLEPLFAAATRGVGHVPSLTTLGDTLVSAMIVPLHTRNTLIGHLCLGPKVSGEPYRKEDQALLSTLSGHLATTVLNIRLVADLQAKIGLLEGQRAALDVLNERLQRAQEEERARLAADLHDEALQTAQQLVRRLVIDGRQEIASGRHLPLAVSLLQQLRAACAAVRPPALEELGLGAAIEVLARDLGAHAGIPIVPDADPELRELSLTPDVELVLYRAAQEALNNSLRHARPTHLLINLRRQDDAVHLSVKDDGEGFAAPVSIDALVAAGHLGLGAMRQRVERAGGRLEIVSTPAKGTEIRVEFTGLGAEKAST